jgi:hypothetical protein
MPASSELLLEQINDLKQRLVEAERSGQPTEQLKEQLRVLGEQFNKSMQALNESKVLKG